MTMKNKKTPTNTSQSTTQNMPDVLLPRIQACEDHDHHRQASRPITPVPIVIPEEVRNKVMTNTPRDPINMNSPCLEVEDAYDMLIKYQTSQRAYQHMSAATRAALTTTTFEEILEAGSIENMLASQDPTVYVVCWKS